MKPSRSILVVEVLHDSLYDESGVVCYQYGNMGEVVAETRIYALPFLSQPIALSTHFDYDSWGRIQCINYPDHEIVRYYYDLGGQLQSISNNSSYKYLDSVKYDRFGAKTSQKYGNGLVTSYTYDSYTRRLSQITVADNSNNPYGDIQYGYDPVGNVTQVTSSCPWLQNQNFSETFTYDASDQLISASETNSGSYQLTVSYGNWGKITCYSLAQADLQNNTTQSEIQSYTYPAANSLQNSQTLFAPAQRTITDANNNVTTEPLTFGINGSLRKRDVQAQNSFTEYYLFNSAANLKAYSNNGLDFAYYGYNAANTRSYKLSFLNQNQWVNGQPEPLDLQLQSAMFYPNAYINFNQNGEYTKHYYNGSERIASRLGSNTHPTDATSNDRLDYRMMCAEEKFRENIQELVSDGQPVDFQGTVELNSLQPVNATSDIFYYHTNHLGSTAYVTDNNATITQGFLYAPFGEITTEYNANFGYNVLPKYSFNAKELDEETGMYYYEARYYKPPVFTSRDPMFEKYFWMTPYAYCANNPVKYVDPDGEELIGALIGAAVKATMEITSQTISNGFANLENGKGFFTNWGKSIDWMDVGVSAAEGFLDGVLPGMGKVGKIVMEGTSMAVRSTIDISGSESNEGKITFKSVFNSGVRHKTWGEAGIDMCGEIFSYGIGKSAGMDDIPFTRSSLAGSVMEVVFKGGFSGAFSTPSEMLKRNYIQKLENNTTSSEKKEKITVGPLEKVEP